MFSDADGLMSALKQWATEVEDLFHVSCRFECAEPILIRDIGTATHLYHIAQEAVNNAIKHGRASRSCLALGRENGAGLLTVEDDGVGIPSCRPATPGLGSADHELPRQHDRRLTRGPPAVTLAVRW